MYKFLLVFILGLIQCTCAGAAVLDLENALRATYTNCVGIETSLQDIKTKAGISTVVTGVGTGLGIGATVAGVEKAKTDALLEDKYKSLEILSYGASSDVETIDKQEWLAMLEKTNSNDLNNKLYEPNTESNDIKILTEKSKKFGAWRTGLLVGNTATNIAGVVISGSNKIDSTLTEQIQNCKSAVQNLSKSIAQARLDGVDVGEALNIESACKDFNYIDAESIAKINNRAKGGMISSAVGTGTGVVGIITSALANSDKVRKDDSAQGKKKEKNLNNTANVLAVSSTLASATATVFNATQIKAIKDVVSVAEKCAGALR